VLHEIVITDMVHSSSQQLVLVDLNIELTYRVMIPCI